MSASVSSTQPDQIMGFRDVLVRAVTRAAMQTLPPSQEAPFWARVEALLSSEGYGESSKPRKHLAELKKTYSSAATEGPGSAAAPAPAPEPSIEIEEPELVIPDDNLLVPPTIAEPDASNIQNLLHRIRDKHLINGPFVDGKPVLRVFMTAHKGIGVLYTSKFRVEGDKNQYNISGRVEGKGRAFSWTDEDIFVCENDRPASANKDFTGTWNGKAVSGAVWVRAVHLPLGREFVLWLNNGTTPNGDLAKRRFRVTEKGISEYAEPL
jgi:hypothetical protein